MNNFDYDVGGRIRELREKAGLSRERFSEMANISAKFLYEIEAGRKGMSAQTLFNIANALNVSSDYILTGIGREEDLTYITNMLVGMTKAQLDSVFYVVKQLRILALGDNDKR